MDARRRGKANPYHEAECIELRAATPRSRRELHGVLKQLGCRAIDDCYAFDRRDQVQPWQSASLFTVDVYLGEAAPYETDDDVLEGLSTQWDRLRVRYLMATVPAQLIGPFVDAVERLAQALGLEVHFAGERRELSQVRDELAAIARWLDEQYFEAGSENLALLIADEYPGP